MRVVFEVAVFARHLAIVPHGEAFAQVCVVGNAEELGAWDTTKAGTKMHIQQRRRSTELTLALSSSVVETSATETRWTACVVFEQTREFFPLEYKYIIKDTQTNDVVSWEAMPGNRTLTLTRTATNIARGKPSTLSSTYQNDSLPRPGARVASLGNNGNRNGYLEWKCTRSEREPAPWWVVDLESSTNKLLHINLWKVMHSHDQPKCSHARPPASAVASGRQASALPPPSGWVFVSNEPFNWTDMDLVDLFAKAKAKTPGYVFPEGIKAFRLKGHEDERVESISLGGGGGIPGRYICITQETTRHGSILQFAELEVFAQSNDSPLKQADGFYGIDAAVESDLKEAIDTEWVDPRGGQSLVRLWLGSFRKDVPAIQWFDGSSSTTAVHVAMHHHVHGNDSSKELTILPVDTRGAALLDKDGTAFRQSLNLYRENLPLQKKDLSKYLNSSSSMDADAATSVETWLDQFASTHSVEDEQLKQLKSHVTSCTFHDGEALLRYGEQICTAFFVIQGQVEVCGPMTATGCLPIASIRAGSVVNDLALFGCWPKRSATVIAKGTVVTQTITHTALQQILGDTKMRAIRHRLIRDRYALATPAPSEAEGASEKKKKLLVVDADHAQVFRTKVPTSVLTSGGSGLTTHKLTLEFYEAAGSEDHTKKGQLRGIAPLLLSQLDAHGEGYLTMPILSSASSTGISVVGQISFHYLVVKPFVHPRNNLSTVWRNHWPQQEPLSGGHRGMGRSFNQVAPFRKALTRENTLASFLLAGRGGADFVEFDVQLTKDHVPVLYHDFIFRVGLEDQHAWTCGTKPEPHEIAIHQLSYRELTRAKTSPVPRKEMPVLKRLIKKHWHAILRLSGRHAATPSVPRPRAPTTEEEDDENHLVDFYPRLQDLLTHVPQEIGLNIEIKYPDKFKRASYRFSPSFAINYYVDRILECVFDYDTSPSRKMVFFSCFDPDIVVALRAKQAKYPVFFLTYGRVDPPIVDARLTLQFAEEFVEMEQLCGMVSNSDAFLEAPECVELIKQDAGSKPMVLLTWGDQNTSYKCVQNQKQYGIDGVISDNIGDLTRQDREQKRG